MNDAYPVNFEIEIDREPLKRHLRSQHRTAWVYGMLFVGVFACFLWATAYFNRHIAVSWTAVVST
ncbi:MAG: hypothetical protein JWM57_3117, partial [Phycisphaerales bacterium]|nr:hypothetical protein [Phycisphaerales bacterium]